MMNETWNPESPGVLRLPSGRLVRGRALRRPLPSGLQPTFALYLLLRQPALLLGKAAGLLGLTSGCQKTRLQLLTRFAKHGFGLKLNGLKSPVGEGLDERVLHLPVSL